LVRDSHPDPTFYLTSTWRVWRIERSLRKVKLVVPRKSLFSAIAYLSGDTWVSLQLSLMISVSLNRVCLRHAAISSFPAQRGKTVVRNEEIPRPVSPISGENLKSARFSQTRALIRSQTESRPTDDLRIYPTILNSRLRSVTKLRNRLRPHRNPDGSFRETSSGCRRCSGKETSARWGIACSAASPQKISL
jgi:hypothetical protein